MTAATLNKPRYSWGVILFMAGIHIGALFALLPSNFNWAAVGVALFLHWITGCLGITLGWHRLITHRSFQTPKWLEYFFLFCGSLSCQGGPMEWVGLHRHHHVHSDEYIDHHDSGKGFWWSHIGWMFYEIENKADIIKRFTKDIADDPVYRFFDSYFLVVQAGFAVVLYLLGGWPFVVWGIFLRLVAVYHCTWLVNSATHKFGYRSHETKERSTNCWWVAVLAYGEGWHNNHHAYQYSARHGLQWWEIDITWMIISALKSLGLATKVKLIGEEG